MLHEANDWGCFAPGMVSIHGAFRINGTSDPDGINDGNTNVISTVARNSAGVFTVTLQSWIPPGQLPIQILFPHVKATASDTTPVRTVDAQYVTNSWNPATRSFQVVTMVTGNVAASAYFDVVPEDPDDNTWVCFKLEGSGLQIGQDPTGV